MRLYSIISPVYNTGKYLDRSIKSVLRQTYSNWELILVDDGSTDSETIQKCDAYAALDSRIRVFHKKNEGQYYTRLFGMKHAKGEFVYFMDSDDYINPRLLRNVDRTIDRTGSDMVIFGWQYKKTRLNRHGPRTFKNHTIITDRNKDSMIRVLIETPKLNTTWTKVVRRDLIPTDVDEKYLDMRYEEDKLLCIPMLLNAPKICYLDKVLYYYVNNPSGMTAAAVNSKIYRQRISNTRTVHQCLAEELKKRYPSNTEYQHMVGEELFKSYIRTVCQYKDPTLRESDDFLSFLQDVQNDEVLQDMASLIRPEVLDMSVQDAWKAYCNGNLKQYFLDRFPESVIKKRS